MRRTSTRDAMGYDWVCTTQPMTLLFCHLNLLVPFTYPKDDGFLFRKVYKFMYILILFLLKYRKIMCILVERYTSFQISHFVCIYWIYCSDFQGSTVDGSKNPEPSQWFAGLILYIYICIHIKLNSRCSNSEASMVLTPWVPRSPSNPSNWRFKTFDRSWMLNWQHRIVGEVRWPLRYRPRKTSDKWGELTPIFSGLVHG